MTPKFRSLLLVSVMVVGGVLAACSGSAPKPTPIGDATKGKDKFVGTCSACHGPDAKGVAGLGKDLTTSEYAKGLTDLEFVAFIKTGRPSSDPLNTTGVDMPPRGGNPALTDKDLGDIVMYVRSLEK